MADYVTLPYEAVKKFITDTFIKRGFSQKDSETISDVITTADLYGIESHGMQRLFMYHMRTKSGSINPTPDIKIVNETPVSALIDADCASGHVAGKYSMELAIRKAKESGIGMVVTKNSTHFGIAGYYSNMARKEGLIGFATTNGLPAIVPTFGKQPMINTNPLAFAMPADPMPYSYDGSTSTVTIGKIEVYNKLDKKLPDGWGLGIDGSASNDTKQVLKSSKTKGEIGGLTPLGGAGEQTCGYKGYGLALIVEILTGILGCGTTSAHTYENNGKAEFAHLFMAIDYGMFGDKAEIEKRLSIYLNEIRNSEKADGCDRIYIHGEKEFENEKLNRELGIKANMKTWQEMQELAEELKIDIKQYFK